MRQVSPYRWVRALSGRALRRLYRGVLVARYPGRVSTAPQNGSPRSILIIRGDAIGDFVLFLPALGILRKHYAGARLSLLVGRECAELATAFAPIDEAIEFDRKQYRFNLPYRMRLIQSLRQRQFDVAINPIYSREPFTDELLYCSGARQRIAFEGDLNNIEASTRAANNRYFTEILPATAGLLQEFERNREFVERLIGTRIPAEEFRPSLPLSESLLEEAGTLLSRQGLDPRRDLIVVMFPGASNHIKMWPAKRYAQLADLFTERFGARILLCGSPSDHDCAEEVTRISKEPPADLVGQTTLTLLAAILRLSALYVGNDSGPLHLAVAVGTPSLGVMGGGHFRRFYPYGEPTKHRMAFKQMDCYNCNWQCIHETVRCIEEISLDEVWQETKKMMEEVVLPKIKGIGTAAGCIV